MGERKSPSRNRHCAVMAPAGGSVSFPVTLLRHTWRPALRGSRVFARWVWRFCFDGIDRARATETRRAPPGRERRARQDARMRERDETASSSRRKRVARRERTIGSLRGRRDPERILVWCAAGTADTADRWFDCTVATCDLRPVLPSVSTGALKREPGCAESRAQDSRTKRATGLGMRRAPSGARAIGPEHVVARRGPRTSGLYERPRASLPPFCAIFGKGRARNRGRESREPRPARDARASVWLTEALREAETKDGRNGQERPH
jgi:hypothetical protein